MKMANIASLLFAGTIVLATQNIYAKDVMSTASLTSQTNNVANVSDADITSNIKSNLSKNSALSDLKIDVVTHNRVVKISGNVNTDEEASKIVEIAESTAGVKSVDAKNLTAKESKQLLTDTLITAKVKGTYMREKLLGEADVSPMSINVETTNGVVYLTGTVETQEQITNAIKLAKGISGVKKVKSKLKVQN